jgi:hypothetical protein
LLPTAGLPPSASACTTPASLVEVLVEVEPLVEAGKLTTPCDTITPDGLALAVWPARAASDPNPLPPVGLDVLELDLELELLDPDPLEPSAPLAALLPVVGMVISAGSRPTAAREQRGQDPKTGFGNVDECLCRSSPRVTDQGSNNRAGACCQRVPPDPFVARNHHGIDPFVDPPKRYLTLCPLSDPFVCIMADTTIRLLHVGTYAYGWEDAGGGRPQRQGTYRY